MQIQKEYPESCKTNLILFSSEEVEERDLNINNPFLFSPHSFKTDFILSDVAMMFLYFVLFLTLFKIDVAFSQEGAEGRDHRQVPRTGACFCLKNQLSFLPCAKYASIGENPVQIFSYAKYFL